MPDSRAVVGALLCSLSALLVVLAFRSADQPPRTTYATASRDIAPGELLAPNDIAYIPMSLPDVVASQAVAKDIDLVGVALLGPVAKGELFQRASLLRRSSADALFSFPVSAANAVSGRIAAGSKISVYSSDGNKTTLVASGLLVTRVDGNDQQSSQGSVVLTVALPMEIDRITLVHAAATNRLTVISESLSDSLDAGLTKTTRNKPSGTPPPTTAKTVVTP